MFAEIMTITVLSISMFYFENDMYTRFNRRTYSDLIDFFYEKPVSVRLSNAFLLFTVSKKCQSRFY